MVQNITDQLIQAVVTILITGFIAWAIPQVKLAWAKALAKNPDLFYALEEAATLAVKAAEQAKLAGFIEDKLDYAMDTAEMFLAARGFKIDLHLLDAAIEKAVLEYFPHTPAGMEPEK